MIVPQTRINTTTLDTPARSRADALKQGLCSSEVVPEDLKLVKGRHEDWFDVLKPQNEFHCWLVHQITIISLRIDRSERIERRVRDKIALRAELTWDSQRRVDAEFLGSGLSAKPGEVVELLQQSPHGCDWLLKRWSMLAYSANVQGNTWTPEQARLAFEMLNTPQPFRPERKPGTSLDLDGSIDDPLDDPASVARREIASLKAQRAVVANLDEAERALTIADLTNEGDPELRRQRRYESALHRRMKWCLDQLHFQSPYRRSPDELRPRYDGEQERPLPPVPKTEAEKLAENHPKDSISPPFDLKPEEYPAIPTEKPDIPAILSARREKRLMVAEARREARRRKVERLRSA